jgi:hypothetical protein
MFYFTTKNIKIISYSIHILENTNCNNVKKKNTQKATTTTTITTHAPVCATEHTC